MNPSDSVNDSERVLELKRYDILDSPPEAQFDEIVELTSTICGTPIALINFIDADRQWTKAKYGALTPTEIPRSHSLCTYTITGTELLEIHDLLQDERSHSSVFVTEGPKFRYYAGMPLINQNGYALGTLCTVDIVPRTLNEKQKITFMRFARLVVEMLEKRLYERKKSLNLEKIARLAEIGEKTAELVHEINNPLGALLLGVSGIRKQFERSTEFNPQKTIEILKKLESYAQRISKISKFIRAKSRDEYTLQMEVLDLRTVLNDSIEISSSRIRELNIELVQDFLTEPLYIVGHPMQIGQIIINLLNNAIDACETVKDRKISIHVKTHEDAIEIRVSDSGPGISPQIENLIFQPFFSTKPAGRGTGLGLSISQNIAREHGGRLFLDHTQHETCFVLSLPFAQSSHLN